MVAQDSLTIGQYVRQLDNNWPYAKAVAPDRASEAAINLPPLDLTLKLRDVYEEVTHSAESDEGGEALS